ncbi:DUF3131 domain-containing protein [Pleurocapsa sp. PCC 7319]|uniref:DUF3131 domain-containing protein n=1 Tax=Pleurocapsa sp. PCC 7319 TaxID=118161 RepID=UPI000348BC9A|nr:DUF3131 domain-containing protein [Pleurocapsa sp. PCC 7319]
MKRKRGFKLIASSVIVTLVSQSLIGISQPKLVLAQESGNSCANIVSPLTPEEETYARSAWQYFLNNYQESTGFTNSFGGYPSGTLWDMGNYLMALNAARWLNLIDQTDFDLRLNKFLASLSGLRLFEDSLPNKVYNTATGEMVDYGNNPVERGIGWSALDIGRILAAFHVLRTCNPQYSEWLQSIVDRWAVERSIQDGYMFGATVLEDGQTLLVQEGRLGYEEYAARGYELWGFAVPKALSYEPFKMVEIYGVQLPVDTRRFQETNANNYVVSESYILDGIEFGFLGQQQEYAERVFEVQRRRYLATGQLTAVTEDNIDGAPYFLYNTIFSNGNAWATITETNELYPEKRSISTKAALGWRYIFPESEYAQQLFQVATGLMSPDGGGFYAGLYEETNQPNKALTGNTNGLIMEILYYKARGNQPLIGGDLVNASTGEPEKYEVVEGFPPPPGVDNSALDHNQTDRDEGEIGKQEDSESEKQGEEETNTTVEKKPQPTNFITIAPIPSVGEIRSSSCSDLTRQLTIPEKRYAKVAWKYFEANYQPETGLVSDRSDMKGTTLWGIGDYLAALQSATALELITLNKFDLRVRQLLATLQRLPLFSGELPHRGYDIRSLEPVDYGNNPTPEGTGWSGLDVGRILLALHNLKSCYPQYTEAIDNILLEWSYLRVVRNGRLNSAVVEPDNYNRRLARVHSVNQLGYEEYAARGFQLWGFNAALSAVGGEYQTESVDGFKILSQRERPGKQPEHNYIVADPFIRYGLELGFDPQMRSLVYPMLQAEARRYRNQGLFSAANTVLIQQEPYIIHSTIMGNKKPWSTWSADSKTEDKHRITSVAAAFAYRALFPEDEYTQKLQQAIVDLYNPSLGYYEGFYETNGKPALGFTSSTNAIVLQSLQYQSRNGQPLLLDNLDLNSPWWKAIAEGTSGNGLPLDAKPQIYLAKDESGIHWDNLNPVDFSDTKTNNYLSSNKKAMDTPLRRAVNQDETQQLSLKTSPPNNQPISFPTRNCSAHPNQEFDLSAAKQAWQYFEQNWQKKTGFVNAVENYPWTTLWDQGSAILGIHSARQLEIIDPGEFEGKISKLLSTLETLPLPATGLPNKAYSTTTGEMRQLDNTPDSEGKSGWSALDTARFLIALHTLKIHYPEYSAKIDKIVSRWDLSKLEQDGWLYGGIPTQQGTIKYFQEGRLGYEQYAAHGLKLWGIEAINALHNPPTKNIEVEGITLKADRRNYANSNAGNYLTNDPYLLWGLEMGWSSDNKSQVKNLLQAQEKRYQSTGILTAVNEDSLDRFPHFLYYSVYANGDRWNAVNNEGDSFPELKFLSTKAAFAAHSLFPNNHYTKSLKQAVEKTGVNNRGYPAGIFENKTLGVNKVFNVNTNAVILEGILYQTRKCPLTSK